eukprot:CAMPEP_0114343998 /NCGR_PEP_ID=MMETSP0101-20121206/11072_1 /TAXON_ID=38822 ORGANISM="Pteridomonas danica, Strain PT" /NCGR_SAMPLE_ID=MMETSP0101 /ASSEMBLY_ACC=CAM_ASM_000211 /LENGTH=88 /DNA_ID=CAMNT_0001479091 /DNA_START=1218 /DNA_END=1484 /DNA_ORIENTATION=-
MNLMRGIERFIESQSVSINSDHEVTEWTKEEADTSVVPQDTSHSDCGVFVCAYANLLSADEPLNFSQNDIPVIRRRIAFDLLNNRIRP